MEDTHANPLYFHDNSPSPFVIIRGDLVGQENQPISSMGYIDPFHTREVEDVEEGAYVMTAKEEALLHTLQNKKLRSRVGKEPVNPIPIQGSSTRRPYPIFSYRRSQSPRSLVNQEPAYNTPINLTGPIISSIPTTELS